MDHVDQAVQPRSLLAGSLPYLTVTMPRALLPFLLPALFVAASAQPEPITTATADGITIYGERFFGGLGDDAPLVLLFHQGGSNGRGEYGALGSWLNAHGFRAIAWDQRSGGDTFGASNRTVATLPAGTSTAYCDTYPDLVAALDYVTTHDLADDVFVWGSSYSAALVVRLAAEHPDAVAGALAFSPASGGPMASCRARQWLDRIRTPLAVFRPASEMARTASVEQRDLFTAAGADFQVIEHGAHGSSMLVDARTQHPMGAARERVIAWLDSVQSGE